MSETDRDYYRHHYHKVYEVDLYIRLDMSVIPRLMAVMLWHDTTTGMTLREKLVFSQEPENSFD
jgi:hypothetical protein